VTKAVQSISGRQSKALVTKAIIQSISGKGNKALMTKVMAQVVTGNTHQWLLHFCCKALLVSINFFLTRSNFWVVILWQSFWLLF
jgi:hypothetical protein